MNTQHLNNKELDIVIEALGECYRRLYAANMSAKELTQEGFTLMFKSAYTSMARHC